MSFTGNLTIGNSVTTIGSDAFNGCRGFTGGLIIPDSVGMIGSRAFYGCMGLEGILFKNKTAIVGNTAFNGAAPVYCHADSTWINNGGGTKVLFITSISADDVTVGISRSGTTSITSDQSTSNAYIPSITYSSSDTSVAILASAATTKGITTNTVNGVSEGTSTVTVTAAQVGSDIFGAAAVPAIPAATFTVTVRQPFVVTNKTWNDDDDRDRARPSSVCLQLYDNGTPTQYLITLTGTGDEWTYTFQDVPVSENYTVVETEVCTTPTPTPTPTQVTCTSLSGTSEGECRAAGCTWMFSGACLDTTSK